MCCWGVACFASTISSAFGSAMAAEATVEVRLKGFKLCLPRLCGQPAHDGGQFIRTCACSGRIVVSVIDVWGRVVMAVTVAGAGGRRVACGAV